MAVITVPGANATIVSNTFNGPANTALAQSIANTLNGLLASGVLSIASVAGGGVAPPPPGPSSELEITTGGVVSVPAGYAFVADGSNNANLTITGGTSFFGGAGNINYTNSGARPVSIAAGDGNDTFNLSGAYTVAAGSGTDHYNLSGTGQVSLGGGSSLTILAGGSDTIFAGAATGQTDIRGGTGSVFFYGGNSSTQVTVAVVGGSGGDTIVGGSNNVLIYASPTAGGASSPGAVLVAGAGNETLFGAPSQTNDQLWGSFTGGNDLLAAGSGNDALVAGSGGHTSLVGGSGDDTFYVINSQLLSTITKTPVTPGVDFIYNNNSGETLALTGFDTLYGAANSGAAANAVKAALAGGGNTVTLKDGTTINFVTGFNHTNVISS